MRWRRSRMGICSIRTALKRITISGFFSAIAVETARLRRVFRRADAVGQDGYDAPLMTEQILQSRDGGTGPFQQPAGTRDGDRHSAVLQTASAERHPDQV